MSVALTTIDLATLLDHAMLRLKKPLAQQTPQIIQQCQESMFMFLVSLANRGLNLWAVEKDFIALQVGVPTYDLLPGTLDLLNVALSMTTAATTSSITDNTTYALVTLSEVVDFNRISLTYPNAVSTSTEMLTISGSYSEDGITYTALPSITFQGTYAADAKIWVDFGRTLTAQYLKINLPTATSGVLSECEVAVGIRDLPVATMNRDTYMGLPNKMTQAMIPTNYWFEKTLTPRLTLWPVPSDATDHLTVMRHRQIQDIGSLSQTIEIPSRWYEGVVWQLAQRLGFEIPDVDDARLQLVIGMADKYLIEAEMDETDGMPSSILPNISCYTA